MVKLPLAVELDLKALGSDAVSTALVLSPPAVFGVDKFSAHRAHPALISDVHTRDLVIVCGAAALRLQAETPCAYEKPHHNNPSVG